jgi:drug/metabolite transporter (DMT)-like permease
MNRRAWRLMALLAGLWGASYLFIKVALDDGLPPLFIVFARIALGALVLVPMALRAAFADGGRPAGARAHPRRLVDRRGGAAARAGAGDPGRA